MIFVMSLLIFVIVSVFLGLGLIVAGKEIRGSCGGLAVMGPDGEPLSCETCPNRGKNLDCEGNSEVVK